MKKSLFIIAAAVALFTACQDNDTFRKDLKEGNSENNGAISFTSFTEKVTKAENSDALYSWSFYDHQETFLVWARKNNQPTKEIFEGDTVFVTEESGVYKYTYAPDRYWDKLADHYNFYAAAPAPVEGAEWSWSFEDGGITTDPTTINKGYFKITGDKFALNGVNLQSVENGDPSDALRNSFKTATNNSKTDVDLLIADETKVERSFYNKANPEAVNLNFIHILSKLNITISTSLDKTGANAHVVDLLAFEVKNVPNTGSFDESITIPNTKKVIRWTLDDDATPSIVNIPTGINAYNADTYAIDNSTKVSVPHATDGKTYIVESLIIPQEIKYQRVALDGQAHDAVDEDVAVPYANYEAYEAAKHNDGVVRLTEDQFNALIDNGAFVEWDNYIPIAGETDESIDQTEFNSRVAEATKDGTTEPYADFAEYEQAKGDNAVLTETQFNALIDNGAFVEWDNYIPIAGETDNRISEATFNNRVKEATATAVTNIPAYTAPSEPYFAITYSVDDVVYTANYNLAAAFLGYNNNNQKYVSGELTDLDLDGADDNDDPTTFGFYEGWQNTLNIIIQPTAIKFTADVAKWSDNTEVDYEIEKGNENPNN